MFTILGKVLLALKQYMSVLPKAVAGLGVCVHIFISYQQRRREYLEPYLGPLCQQHQEGKL